MMSWWRASAVAALVGAGGQALACEPTKVLRPVRGEVIADARPVIAWGPLPGAKSYRVQLEARVPEGRMLATIDTVVSATTFSPPQPLTDYRAAVKVRVTAECPTAGFDALREQPAWFFVDTALACAAPTDLRFDAATSTLEWRGGGAAQRYEVFVYAGAEGALKHRGEALASRAVLPRGLKSGVAAVRPRCANGYGAMAFLPIAPAGAK
jgi:hypothetical protein